MGEAFDRQVAAFVDKYNKRMRAAAKTAVQDTVALAQRPGPKGTMRIDTGFLRASISAALGRMPSGPSSNEEGREYPKDGTFFATEVATTLIRWQPGEEVIYVGWCANYARPREYVDRFMRNATDQWQQTVDKAVKAAKKAL